MLRGEHGEFWLEPVAVSPEEERVRLEERLEDAGAEGRSSAGLHRKSTLGRPHLVFRRSAEQPQLEIGAAGRTRRRRKKKRKLERNCGTRGENLPTPFFFFFFFFFYLHHSLSLFYADSLRHLPFCPPPFDPRARFLSVPFCAQTTRRKVTISRVCLTSFSCSTC